MPDPEPLGVGIVHAVNAVDQYIQMLELEKTIVEADMTALETFSRDTQVIMHKAIYLEWVKWGWKGSNEQTAHMHRRRRPRVLQGWCVLFQREEETEVCEHAVCVCVRELGDRLPSAKGVPEE